LKIAAYGTIDLAGAPFWRPCGRRFSWQEYIKRAQFYAWYMVLEHWDH